MDSELVQAEGPARKKFGTFTGVFTPTLLTILGVIMYVRMGWVVGNGGLGIALLILALGILITLCTGLSLSSIATNTRIGDGGPYAIMTKSLGLEVGGSIGIPLFLTRPLGVAMYIFGFREGVQWAAERWFDLQLSGVVTLGIDLGIFLVLFAIAFASADLAFKTQYLIMGLIALSLISIFASPVSWREPVAIEWIGHPLDEDGVPIAVSFWVVFAVFFPATTGILAGANMSGDLEDPRRSIPTGTLWAIAVSSVVYFAVAFWCARTGTLTELATNTNHIIDKSLYPPVVFAGLLGATASSALAGLVGGPRILMAMGQNRVVPYSEALAEIRGGEPRTALLVTGALTVACIMMRDLNAIAPLVTMFFLITYCMINVVVLFESSLGLVSYRPTLEVPRTVPAVGLAGCIFSMFIINPSFSLVSVGIVTGLYFFMRTRTQDRTDKEDPRSNVFTAFAEWAAARVTPAERDNVRSWKPHLFVPTDDAQRVRGSFPLLLDLAAPEGSVHLIGVNTQGSRQDLGEELEELRDAFREADIFSSYAVVREGDFIRATNTSLEALQSAFFRPNLLFAQVPEDAEGQRAKKAIIDNALQNHVGVALFRPHESAGLGRAHDVHLWVAPPPEGSLALAFERGNLNLALLLGYRLSRTWRGHFRIFTIVREGEDDGVARRFLEELCDLARLPASVECVVARGDFATAIEEAPVADLSIFGLFRRQPDLEGATRIAEQTRGSCLFVIDSGRESARA
jgi:amino acid transporter